MIRARTYLCIFVIFSLLVITSAVSAVEMSSKRDCAICHIMWIDDFRTDKKTLIKWQPGNVLMKDTQGVVSSEEICYSCHDGYVNDSRSIVWKYSGHKTFVKPSSQILIPSTLSLSNKGEIYCGTCHSPHGAGAAPDDSGITSFFKEKNIDSSLCAMCHTNEADFKRSNSHPLQTAAFDLPDTLFKLGSKPGTNKNNVICQTCHKAHGARGNKITVVDNRNSKLCVTCHNSQKSLITTKHDLRTSFPDEKNIKQQRPVESGPCGVCHTPHNAGGKRLWARGSGPGDPASGMCLSCHDGEEGGYQIKGVGDFSHPINIEPASNVTIPKELPLYSTGLTKTPKGRIQCFSCHDVHRWSPASPTEKNVKDVEGDASNSFLRISNSESSTLCLQCHTDKKQIVTSDHNLTVTAPEEKNLQGFTPSISGPCGACHIPHNAVNDKLWAKQLIGNKDIVTQFCTACHSKNRAAKTKLIGDNYHPVDVAFEELNLKDGGKEISALLPFFDSAGDRMSDGKDGKMACITCHEPHRWNPKDSGPVLNYTFKNIEGDTTNSFLRKPNFPSSDLCKTCHADKALVDGTKHDLNVTAPNAKNLLGQTVKESGQCGVCHLVHNSPNKLKLWARPYGPISEKESIINALCTGCHSKGNIAKNKVPPVVFHPEGKLVDNELQLLMLKIRTPLYDKDGMEVNIGYISCPTCHNAHQWSSFLKKKGVDKNIEGNAITSFLRNVSYNIVCKDCHAQDAIFRYRYFHIPHKRGGKKPQEKIKFRRF
jgi:predicted CXXCH cytochrome family protein